MPADFKTRLRQADAAVIAQAVAKMKCSCGYETEHRCRVHPARPAHWCPAADARGAIWLCHDCEAMLMADKAYNFGYGDSREYAVARYLESSFVLCPGCAQEQAILEDATRETEAFWASLPRGDQFLDAAEQEVEAMLAAHRRDEEARRREVWLVDRFSAEEFKI